MSMEFCKECGAMLSPKKVEEKIIMICPKCGEGRELSKDEQKLPQDLGKNNDESILVIENPDDLNTMPTKPMLCKKCDKKQKTAYWTVQTRSGDEAPTRFYRCTVCKTTWREYD